LVKVTDREGKDVVCRELLDSGSKSSFITDDCARKLGLKQHSVKVPICTLGTISTQASKRVKIVVQSRINKFTTNIDCLIIDHITQAIPLIRVNVNDIHIPEGISLADPEFHKSSKVDLFLGAEVFFDLLCIGRIKDSRAQPTWQKTLFDWIASGNLITGNSKRQGVVCNLVINDELKSSLARFWQIEHDKRQNTRSHEERMCEEHFARTYKRNEQGRFIVSLPAKEDQLQRIGNSRETALQRFNSLEKRFRRQPQLRDEYSKFMHEYLDLKHMREIQQDDIKWNTQPQYYLPHHCIVKETSVTTRLRVVFDASSKSSSGISLNDALMTGPILQQNLFSILLRFRTFKYVMISDIAKMYRQILLDERQTSLQRIVWRDNPTEHIKTYELLTLTYGTTSASFLATKVIHQLSELEKTRFPIGATIAKRDFYMDDLLTGANSIDEARTIRDQVTALLLKGGFVLRKWASNSEELLRDIPGQIMENSILELDKDDTAKTLGVNWNRSKDSFQYLIKMSFSTLCTKRTVLSSIAQLFDPLGLLAPVIVTAKILIQELWKLQIEWDESLPSDILTRWSSYVIEMQQLNGFCVKRYVGTSDLVSGAQLHGFCDASKRTYGACVYLRTLDQNNSIQVHLLGAKSRVAPIKTVSIPRLKLCGAQLLVQLVNRIKASLIDEISKVHYWTDSSIVLHWIKSSNKKLPVFVAHRVGEIQEFSMLEEWNHVRTKENPADLVSRGVTPKELRESQLWWSGPAWLKNSISIQHQWPLEEFEEIPPDDSMQKIP